MDWRTTFARFGMPFAFTPKPDLSATSPGCRAVVATRLDVPELELAGFRALHFAQFTTTGRLEDPAMLRGALSTVPGLDAAAIVARIGDDDVVAAYAADRARARTAAGSPTEFQGRAANTDGAVRYTDTITQCSVHVFVDRIAHRRAARSAGSSQRHPPPLIGEPAGMSDRGGPEPTPRAVGHHKKIQRRQEGRSSIVSAVMSADHATVPVTVLLPVFNGGGHLATAVSSILGQTHEAIELLVIDDGSTDGTAALLASLTDPRVTVVSQPNRGLVATLNTGLSLARHDLVARMDADDVSHPRRLGLQLDYLTAHPRVAAVGCCYEVVDDHGGVVTQVHTAADPPYLRRQLFFRNVLPHAGMMFRRSAVVAVGGYRDVGPVEDYDLWARLAVGNELASLPDVLLSYRLSSSGISANAGDVQIQDHRLVRNRMLAEGAFPDASVVRILREGLQHDRKYAGTCPGALRSYVFDHIWLAALLTRGGRLRSGISLMTGTVALAVLRPRAFAGFLDVAKNVARRLPRGAARL